MIAYQHQTMETTSFYVLKTFHTIKYVCVVYFQVSRKACGQLADSLMLQSLISKFVHQGTVYTQNDHYEKFLDGQVFLEQVTV